MPSIFANALSCLISQHTSLSPSRRETLAWLVVLIMRQGSVCLWRLAAHVATRADLASVQRRFYRFFQFASLDSTVWARMIVALLELDGKPWVLAIDRTTWDFGRSPINILMIAVDWQGVGIPLIWTLLPKDGNAATADRTALLDRLAETFPALTIAHLTGDREFIGAAWMADLCKRHIPFVLRLRENQYVQRQGYAEMPIANIAQDLKPGHKLTLKQPCRLGREGEAPPVRIVILRLATGELLALAASANPRSALARYRGRWRIECLFANLKSKGFNLEDTHLTCPRKLATLLGILALAVALAAKSGAKAHDRKAIPVKTHGRRAASLFAHGRAILCKALAHPDLTKVVAALRQILTPTPSQATVKQCQV